MVAKKAPHTYRKCGANPLFVIESLSPLLGYRKIKEVRPSSRHMIVVTCVFNCRQYNFVIGPMPVYIPEPLAAAYAAVLPIAVVVMAFSVLSRARKAGWQFVAGCLEAEWI